MTSREIQDWLVARIAELLDVDADSLDIRESFANHGLSSRDAVALSGDLEELLGRRLSPTLAYEHPSIWAISQHLGGSGQEKTSKQSGSSAPSAGYAEIAVIGMACRFPGSDNLDDFWRTLSEGRDQIREVPADRWPKEAFYHPDPSYPGKSISYWGGFLNQIDQFDPFFFGISPIEAKYMDPQQRLLMELAHEAIDHAGDSKEALEGSKTGVFVGISVNEYSQHQLDDPRNIVAHTGTGSALSIAANRISYYYNLHGPSMAIDTACSSSLTAIHLACQSLRSRESSLAIAGGVNMILSPAHSIAFTKAGVLAPDGRCKTFDARADGYVRGEGGGLVVLKLLSDALADGDTIHAVILGSAMSQDGRTNGLMAPSQESQEQMLREAYRAAGIPPSSVQYVEAHGTGTLLGDSMEAAALGAVVGAGREGDPCAIGSVKTNIGHLEAAAGVAGLIKVILSLQHRAIPPSLHFESPNPLVPFDDLHVQVPRKMAEWPQVAGPAIAGVSSFGFGGTNVHLVVREAPQAPQSPSVQDGAASPPCNLLPLSANDQAGLRALAQAVHQHLSTDNAFAAQDVCKAAWQRRSLFDHRLAVVGGNREQLAGSLHAFLSGEADPNTVGGGPVPARQPKATFVFAGQGGQWLGMGCDLLKREPAFYKAIEQIDDLVQARYGWSLIEVLLATDSAQALDEIAIVQPAIFAVQVALAQLLQSWGIVPDAVVGHSMGEVAATHIAGVLTLEDAITVICERSILLKEVKGRGSMMATELTPEQASEVLQGYEDHISLAVVNGPAATVLSGDPDKLQEVMDRLNAQNLFCKWVKVDVASHSPQMDILRPRLMEVLSGLRPRPARIPVYSTVTGKSGSPPVFDAAYWVDNLRMPVLFSDAIDQLRTASHTVFIEVGPHPILLGAIQQAQQAHGALDLLPTMRREEPEHEVLLRTLGTLYTKGFQIVWERLYPGSGRQVPFPPLTWQRQRYWLEPQVETAKQSWLHRGDGGTVAHPLLGERIELAGANATQVWQSTLDSGSLPYLKDHRVEGEVVLPATAYIEMALRAAEELGLGESHVISEFAFIQKMALPDGKPQQVQCQLAGSESGELAFRVYGRPSPKQSWTLYATAVFSPDTDGDTASYGFQVAEFRAASYANLGGDTLNESYQRLGIEYGPAFRGLEQVWIRQGEALGNVVLPSSLRYEADAYLLHPALLDACLQVLGATSSDMEDQPLYLPAGCASARLFGKPTQQLWCHALVTSDTALDSETLDADIRIYDESHHIIAELLGFRVRRIARHKRPQFSREDTWLYQVQWQQHPGPDRATSCEIGGRNWLVLADDQGLGAELAKLLEAKGHHCRVVLYREVLEGLEGQSDEAMLERLELLLKETASPLHGVVHLWSLSMPVAAATNPATDHESAYMRGCNSVILLVQALANRLAASPRLWLVTRGAHDVLGAESVAVEQSTLWGLGKVISFELPDLKCVRIDLDPAQADKDLLRLLGQQVLEDAREDQVAFRGGERHVLRMLPYRQPAFAANAGQGIREDGSYLITGGMGGLGFATARWLAHHGARHLVLMGRSAPSPEVEQVVEDMRADGVSVVFALADVSDQEQVEAIFERMAEEMPPLRGVIHAAGILDDGSLLNMSSDRMQAVMAPKVEGTWNLHCATMERELDFFVLFSSAVSVLGSPGQGNYAAGSAYLDAMAHHRQHLGLPALSINWGPWAEVGLAAEASRRLEEQNASTQHLVKMIEIDQGLEVLEFLLSQAAPQVAALPFDLKNLLELYPTAANMAFFSEIGGAGTQLGRMYARPKLKQEYAAPRNEIERTLADLWQQTLHIDRVGIHDSFFELGGDSVLASQVLASARKTYGISINPQDAFKTFTIERLAEMLADEIMRQVEEMSDEEAERLLSTLR